MKTKGRTAKPELISLQEAYFLLRSLRKIKGIITKGELDRFVKVSRAQYKGVSEA